MAVSCTTVTSMVLMILDLMPVGNSKMFLNLLDVINVSDDGSSYFSIFILFSGCRSSLLEDTSLDMENRDRPVSMFKLCMLSENLL